MASYKNKGLGSGGSPDLNEDVGSAYTWDRDGHLNDATSEVQKAIDGIWPVERLEYENDCDPEKTSSKKLR